MPKRKTENWEKILNGGPYFEGTLQKPTGVSESSPVAGTIENSTFSEILDAGRTREVQQIRPAATHLLSVDCLYQMNKKNCKREFENCASLPKWSPRIATRSCRGNRVRPALLAVCRQPVMLGSRIGRVQILLLLKSHKPSVDVLRLP